MPQAKGHTSARMIKCNICKEYKLWYNKYIGMLIPKRIICKSCEDKK